MTALRRRAAAALEGRGHDDMRERTAEPKAEKGARIGDSAAPMESSMERRGERAACAAGAGGQHGLEQGAGRETLGASPAAGGRREGEKGESRRENTPPGLPKEMRRTAS